MYFTTYGLTPLLKCPMLYVLKRSSVFRHHILMSIAIGCPHFFVLTFLNVFTGFVWDRSRLKVRLCWKRAWESQTWVLVYRNSDLVPRFLDFKTAFCSFLFSIKIQDGVCVTSFPHRDFWAHSTEWIELF